MAKAEKVLIGRQEIADFPELNIYGVVVRVDSGARTSSLHAEDMEEFVNDGEDWVRFHFGLDETHEAPIWKKLYVRSSNGKRQERYFIKSKVKFANGKTYPIKLSLTDRKSMKYPCLLGRRILAGRFIVDVQRTFVLGDSVS